MTKVDRCECCGEVTPVTALRYSLVREGETFDHEAEAHVDGRAYLCGNCRSQRKA